MTNPAKINRTDRAIKAAAAGKAKTAAIRFVWARNRSASGRGSDPMPQIIRMTAG